MTSEQEGMLDQTAVVRRRDPGNMLGHAAGFAAQLRSGWDISRALQLGRAHVEATSVVVLGMGGSAACADVARAVYADQAARSARVGARLRVARVGGQPNPGSRRFA